MTEKEKGGRKGNRCVCVCGVHYLLLEVYCKHHSHNGYTLETSHRAQPPRDGKLDLTLWGKYQEVLLLSCIPSNSLIIVTEIYLLTKTHTVGINKHLFAK